MLKLSIITAVYNGAATITDCLQSVRSQTYSAEHLIIDGNSSDNTLEIAKRHSPNACIVSESDTGIYNAMNKGIAMASGDIIGFLNADDVYADNKVLERVIAAFGNLAIDACYSDLVYVEQEDLTKVVRYWKSRDYQDGLFKRGWSPAHPTFFVHKFIYEKYGYFDLDYKLAADFEIMMRLIGKYKINSLYIPKVLVKMRLGGATNKSLSNIIKQNLEIMRSYKKNNIKFSFFSFIANKIVNRIRQLYSLDKYNVS